MSNIVLLFFILFVIIYFVVLFGLLYLSYTYIKYINKLEKDGCKCSEDVKRDMVKNFSYIILGSWVLLVIAILVSPPIELRVLLKGKLISIINFLIIGGYGVLLFLYSKKLIDESCECSQSWVRDAMQYQSYVYIGLSISSFFLILIKLLLGDDKKELQKLLKAIKK